ncbi:hypothetical protein [Paenibacillus illinoisensis]|uniref:Uncharacterized protein n=1 Tax=Paenibacillus illinoisensis TaxID=59845 RepID=A0A2W0CX41_9BACL|nr:hypothetical protein [Paenibacillus illinoisensis]PYY28221.1 hypothetical protein PIL02S_03367 [Paenibacillus illinoisensis]
MSFIFELLSKLNLSDLIIALISVFLTAIVTLVWVDKLKQKSKKRTLITLMSILAESVTETVPNYEGKGEMIFSKFRSETIWRLLESETLDMKKEKDLFNKLTHLAMHINTFDSYVDAYNFSVLTSEEKGEHKKAVHLLVKMHKIIRSEYKEVETLIKSLKL